MVSFSKVNNPGTRNNLIATIQANLRWLRTERNKTILILAILGIIVFILSIVYQDIYYAIVRGFIFSIACFIFYFKSDFIVGYSIQFYEDGKIIVKRGLIKRVISYSDLENILLFKKGRYWLIGEKRNKVLIAAFPDLDKKINAIK